MTIRAVQLGALVGLASAVVGCGSGEQGPHVTPEQMTQRLAEVLGDRPSDLVCEDTPHAHKGVITDCKSAPGFLPESFRITWDDDRGHFTIERQAP